MTKQAIISAATCFALFAGGALAQQVQTTPIIQHTPVTPGQVTPGPGVGTATQSTINIQQNQGQILQSDPNANQLNVPRTQSTTATTATTASGPVCGGIVNGKPQPRCSPQPAKFERAAVGTCPPG